MGIPNLSHITTNDNIRSTTTDAAHDIDGTYGPQGSLQSAGHRRKGQDRTGLWLGRDSSENAQTLPGRSVDAGSTYFWDN